MVYVYEKNGEIKYTRNERPQVENIIELERMIPMPQKAGYISVLRADFKSKTVWYVLIKTEEQIKKERVARLRYWFDTEYREENEKATRFAALEIEYEHYDEFRDKTYHSLNDLYLEAEVVREEINNLEGEV